MKKTARMDSGADPPGAGGGLKPIAALASARNRIPEAVRLQGRCGAQELCGSSLSSRSSTCRPAADRRGLSSSRTTLDKDFLAVIRAAEAVWIVDIADNAEVPVMTVIRIAPLIVAVGTAGVEAIVVFVASVSFDMSQFRFLVIAAPSAPPTIAPGHGRAAAPTAAADGVPADSPMDAYGDHARRIGRAVRQSR